MITNLKELKALLQLLRKQGVTDFEFDKIKLKLGELPVEAQVTTEEVHSDDGIDELVGLNQPGFEGIDSMAFYSAPTQGQEQ